ncbi:2-dehydro-3-deoxyphosphooctonate aldolase [Pararhodobacter oceanensis]|uniref:2-dehydro-3-deoxyphosphooctonate aldolase n=2 Tax=Pararhodobacter oceanensis TaxID=2172121 RepID=A0A2T8HX21_9RHOB|nr:2-dehydro-3-deoxyphosphooctonate aldolase [Pararhodobacter oceanensis]
MTPQDSLVALMITVSAADSSIRTAELLAIEQVVNQLPVFAGFDTDRIKVISQTVFDLLEVEDGLDAIFGLLREALPPRLNETAYALACDVAASDGKLMQSELRLLEEIRHELNIDRLHAAAIERGARARFMHA